MQKVSCLVLFRIIVFIFEQGQITFVNSLHIISLIGQCTPTVLWFLFHYNSWSRYRIHQNRLYFVFLFQIEEALVRRKKMELLQKYASESLMAQSEEAKALLGL